MKKNAIIFDMDNTILYQTNRNPFDWRDLSGDKPIKNVIEVLENLSYVNLIILVTGRPESVRSNTEQWLLENDIPYDELYMKQGDPKDKAFISKENNLKKIQEKYNVIAAFEDDNKCAEMYVKNNIITFVPLNYKIK